MSYCLVTPAHNEEQYIERTITSVVQQTVRPRRWVIVSDGSTDRTAQIIESYTNRYDWIRLLRLPTRQSRHFAAKVQAFNAGYAELSRIEHAAIGSLDADTSFGPDYFEFLLTRLEENPRLGVVGTPFEEQNRTYNYRFVSVEHVSGACQFFRRECFEAIGGYVAMESGGIDHVAVISARMKGWETRTFTGRVYYHHRPMGSALHNVLRSKLRVGMLDYALGAHPLWEISRVCYQCCRRPFVIGGLMISAGYFSSMIRRRPRPVSPELVRFRRHEQMARLRSFLRSGRAQVPRSISMKTTPVKTA